MIFNYAWFVCLQNICIEEKQIECEMWFDDKNKILVNFKFYNIYLNN